MENWKKPTEQDKQDLKDLGLLILKLLGTLMIIGVTIFGMSKLVKAANFLIDTDPGLIELENTRNNICKNYGYDKYVCEGGFLESTKRYCVKLNNSLIIDRLQIYDYDKFMNMSAN